MKICVIGAGYVGVVTGACFAKLGHDVVCVDVVKEKVDAISASKATIYEDGLDELLNEVKPRLSATTDLASAVKDMDVVFVCVGTPSKDDGSIDLTYVMDVADKLNNALSGDKTTIVMKSTVVPGTTAEFAKRLGRAAVAVNPEFLREGHAIHDFMNPDRIVIGAEDERARKTLEELYSGFGCPKVYTDLATAEMIKYASNAFLATKISFINEIGNICKRMGIDVYEVAEGMGHDARIGRLFLSAGAGFGGSCFSKDLRALIQESVELGYTPQILRSVVNVNETQPSKLLEIARKRTDLKGKTVAVLGLAFKPGTDDVRKSPSLRLIDELLKEAGSVRVYDPKAMENTKKAFGDKVYYARDARDALDGANVCFLMTAWEEFRDKALYEGKDMFIIDGKNVIRLDSNYEGICW